MQEFFLKKVATNDACAHPDHLKTRINFQGFLPWPPSEASFVDLKVRILSPNGGQRGQSGHVASWASHMYDHMLSSILNLF